MIANATASSQPRKDRRVEVALQEESTSASPNGISTGLKDDESWRCVGERRNSVVGGLRENGYMGGYPKMESRSVDPPDPHRSTLSVVSLLVLCWLLAPGAVYTHTT